jgi:hypothetical protein
MHRDEERDDGRALNLGLAQSILRQVGADDLMTGRPKRGCRDASPNGWRPRS